MRAFNLVLIASFVVACGPGGRKDGVECPGLCTAFGYQACHTDGSYDPPVACGPDQTCDPNHGCVVCVPEQPYCGGPTNQEVLQCNSDGTGGTHVADCAQNEVCSGGDCKTPCEAALDNPSNVGCDFWAADLDNEAFNLNGISNNAATQQFAVVVANNNEYPVTVTVTKNNAKVGQPLNEQVVATATVAPRVAQRIDLPYREVDGSMGQNGTYSMNSGSGTFVSPHAYHVVTTGPVVVYQFNPIIQQFSNDASTLIPIQALGSDYVIIGYQTANPCGDPNFMIQSIPDHSSITIVAPYDDTHVTVVPTHPILASGGDSGFPIARTAKNGTLTFTTGKYTVVNLESEQPVTSDPFMCINSGQDGDFTGTTIHSDKPIVVFTSGERGAGFGGATNVQNPPDWDPQNGDDTCCTDHLEEQLLPVTALGKEFAVARSPIRSTHATWVEPDIVRVVATVDGTHITTNLPAPYNSFTLDRNKQKTFAATSGFALSADQPVQVAQYLVSQHFVKYGYIGDPSQLLIPAAEQHRRDYVFLVPATFTKNYMVFARQKGADIILDGVPLSSIELSMCKVAPIGTIQNIEYEQVTCPAGEGHHTASSQKPFGLSAYGYYNVGSYAFVGGSDVKIINPIL